MSITREELTRMAEACDLGLTVGPLATLLDHEWESLHLFALMAYEKGGADASAAPGWLYTRALENERDATGALARHLGRTVEAQGKTIAALEAERDRLLAEVEVRADGMRVRKDRIFRGVVHALAGWPGAALATMSRNENLGAACPLVERGVRPLAWTAERQPDRECPYNHCIAETPFGRFLLTWKGWKGDIDPVADETPWGEFFNPYASTVVEAQEACEREFARRVKLCLAAQREADGNTAT